MEKKESLTSTTIPAARRDPQALHLRKKGVKEAKAPPLCFWPKMPMQCALNQRSNKMKEIFAYAYQKKNQENKVSFRIF